MFKNILDKSKTVFVTLIIAVIMLSTFSMDVFATDEIWPEVTSSQPTLSPTDSPGYTPSTLPDNDIIAGDIDDARNVYNAYVDVMPVVSTNDILKWATTKGNEIIYFLQIIVQPFTIIIFIIAAFITLIGSIGRGDMVGKGLWGMLMSVLVYAAVLYAPVILQTFVGWVAS